PDQFFSLPRQTLAAPSLIPPCRSREFSPAEDRPVRYLLAAADIFLRRARNRAKLSEVSRVPARPHNQPARPRLCDWNPETRREFARPSARRPLRPGFS